MFETILIADYEPMASCIRKTCEELEIDAFYLPSKKIYSDPNKIIEAATKRHVDAIHPGSNPMAYNPILAELCEDNGIVYIGQTSRTLRRINKSASFNENSLKNSRYVEVQLLAKEGSIINLGERECLVRVGQENVMKETPSYRMTDDSRKEVVKRAVQQAIDYECTNAFSVEFLFDKNNLITSRIIPRIQPGYSITELVTGVDIVKLSIKIAADEKLDYRPEDIKFRGHALYLKIRYKGKPTGYIPLGGPGVRINIHPDPEFNVPLLSSSSTELSIWGINRQEVIERMRWVFPELERGLKKVKNNVSFHKSIFENCFIPDNWSPSFIQKNIAELYPVDSTQTLKIKRKVGKINPWTRRRM